MTAAITTPAKRKAPTGVRWKKGQSGNPAGRRRGSVSLAAALQRLLIKEPSRLESICKTICDAAAAGDVSAARLLFERLDGQKATGFFNISVDASDRRTAISISPQILSEIAESRREYERKILCQNSPTI